MLDGSGQVFFYFIHRIEFNRPVESENLQCIQSAVSDVHPLSGSILHGGATQSSLQVIRHAVVQQQTTVLDPHTYTQPLCRHTTIHLSPRRGAFFLRKKAGYPSETQQQQCASASRRLYRESQPQHQQQRQQQQQHQQQRRLGPAAADPSSTRACLLTTRSPPPPRRDPPAKTSSPACTKSPPTPSSP